MLNSSENNTKFDNINMEQNMSYVNDKISSIGASYPDKTSNNKTLISGMAPFISHMASSGASFAPNSKSLFLSSGPSFSPNQSNELSLFTLNKLNNYQEIETKINIENIDFKYIYDILLNNQNFNNITFKYIDHQNNSHTIIMRNLYCLPIKCSKDVRFRLNAYQIDVNNTIYSDKFIDIYIYEYGQLFNKLIALFTSIHGNIKSLDAFDYEISEIDYIKKYKDENGILMSTENLIKIKTDIENIILHNESSKTMINKTHLF